MTWRLGQGGRKIGRDASAVRLLHLGHGVRSQRFQLFVQGHGGGGDEVVPELAEERRGFVVLQAGFTLFVLVDEQAERRVEAGSDVGAASSA